MIFPKRMKYFVPNGVHKTKIFNGVLMMQVLVYIEFETADQLHKGSVSLCLVAPNWLTKLNCFVIYLKVCVVIYLHYKRLV